MIFTYSTARSEGRYGGKIVRQLKDASPDPITGFVSWCLCGLTYVVRPS